MSKRLPALLLGAIVAMGVAARSATAESIAIDIETPLEPAAAVGLLITPTKVTEKPGAQSERRGRHIVVSFPVGSSEVNDDTVATAFVLAEDGQMIFGPVKPLRADVPRESLAALPTCPGEKTVLPALDSQFGLLQSLVDVRAQRRENLLSQVRSIMTPEFRERVARLEQGFGLAGPTPLSADTHPLEIIDRVNRLLSAIRRYREARARQPAAEGNSAAAE